MICACFTASGPGSLAIIDGAMNSELYKWVVQENVNVSILNWSSTERGSCSKATTHNTHVILPKSRTNVKFCNCWVKVLTLNFADLKQAVHKRKPTNISESKPLCKDEWPKIPPSWWYWKHLVEDITATKCYTSYRRHRFSYYHKHIFKIG